MIFTQEAPLTRKWSSGRSCIRSNRNNLGVNFEEGGNRSTRRKPEYPEETGVPGGNPRSQVEID